MCDVGGRDNFDLSLRNGSLYSTGKCLVTATGAGGMLVAAKQAAVPMACICMFFVAEAVVCIIAKSRLRSDKH